MIHQTWFGKILCGLGMHLLTYATDYDPNSGYPRSTYGGCVRCNSMFQWDF